MSWKDIIKAPTDTGSPAWGWGNEKDTTDLIFSLELNVGIIDIDSDLKSLGDDYDYPLIKELYNVIEMALMQKLEGKEFAVSLNLTDLESQMEEDEREGFDSLDDNIRFAIESIVTPKNIRTD